MLKKPSLPPKINCVGLLQPQSLRTKIINWNENFPVDYWWRKQYSIAFGSRAHLEMNFIAMAMEYVEYVEFRCMEIEEILSRTGNIEESSDQIKMTKKEIDKEFDELDIDQY